MEDCAGGGEAGAAAPERSLCAAVYTAVTLNREPGRKPRGLCCLSPPSASPMGPPGREARAEGAPCRPHRERDLINIKPLITAKNHRIVLVGGERFSPPSLGTARPAFLVLSQSICVFFIPQTKQIPIKTTQRHVLLSFDCTRQKVSLRSCLNL